MKKILIPYPIREANAYKIIQNKINELLEELAKKDIIVLEDMTGNNETDKPNSNDIILEETPIKEEQKNNDIIVEEVKNEQN